MTEYGRLFNRLLEGGVPYTPAVLMHLTLQEITMLHGAKTGIIANPTSADFLLWDQLNSPEARRVRALQGFAAQLHKVMACQQA